MRLFAVSLLIFLVFFHRKDAQAADDEEETLVQTDSIATRKVLGRCWLVINEFKFGSPDTEYIELYKACPRDASLTDRRLRNVVGYYLLGATNQGIEFFEEVGHRGKAFMAPRLLNDIGQNEMYFLIGSKDVPGVTLSPAAIGGRSTIFSTSTNSPNMILLLYFPARTTRKELEKLQPIQKGIFKRLALTPERVSIIKTGLQDGIIYGTHDGTDPFSEIMTSYVITKGIYVLQTQSDSQQQGMSISRCGSEARFDVASWKYSSPTPMLPNSCISGIPFIISLKSLPSLTYPHQMGGVPLQHSAQQLVRNARYFFESAQTNPVLLQGTPSELVCRVLNLSPKTLLNLSSRKVIETPGKVRQVKSHAIDKIDCFDRDLIKRIILGHYKNNRPPFLMDIYRDFITKSKNTEISRYDGVTDSPSQQNEAFAIDEEEDLCQRSSVQSTPTRDKSPEPAAIPEAVSTPRRPKPLISVQSFRKLLHSMGLKYGRVNERMAIVQRTDVVAWRRKYLRALRKNRDDSNPREVFYLDETWLDQNVRFGRGWVPKYCESFKLFKDYSCAKTKIGKGPRLVVIGIASDKRGLIKELTKVFPITASKSQDDYHSNVDGELFTKYITEVLEFLKAENDKKPAEDRRGAVLVMDNAPYHTIADVPKLNNRKQVIYDWLKTRIQAGDMVEPDDMDTMLKAELWQLVQKLKSKNDYYKIDKIIRDYGHQVLRLPPYQCDLNPIEFVWSNLKTQIKKDNREQTLQSVKALAEDAVNNYKMSLWTANLNHCNRLGQRYWDDDGIIEEKTIQLNIQLTEEDYNDDMVMTERRAPTFGPYQGWPDLHDLNALGLSHLIEDPEDDVEDEIVDIETVDSQAHDAFPAVEFPDFVDAGDAEDESNCEPPPTKKSNMAA